MVQLPKAKINNYLANNYSKSTQPAKPAETSRKDPFEVAFSLDKIGTGGRFVAGSKSGKRKGLWGALRAFKVAHKYGEAGNLSEADLKVFHEELSKKLKGKSSQGSSGFTGRDKAKLFSGVKEKYIKKGELSWSDFRDFKKIVNALSDSRSVKEDKPNNQPKIISRVQRKEEFPTELVKPKAPVQEINKSVGSTVKLFLSPLISAQQKINTPRTESFAGQIIIEPKPASTGVPEKKIVPAAKNVAPPETKRKEPIEFKDLPID